MLEPTFKLYAIRYEDGALQRWCISSQRELEAYKRTAIDSSESEGSRSDDEEKIECDEQENVKFEGDELRCLMT